MTSGLLLALGLVPAIPFFPFFILACAMAGIAYQAQRKHAAADELSALEAGGGRLPDGTMGQGALPAMGADGKPAAPVAEEPISSALAMDIIRLEMGYGLLPLVQSDGSQKLTDQIKGLRRQLAEDMGYVLPSVRIQDNLQLAANDYVVKIKEIEVGRGEVRTGMLLCMDPAGGAIDLPGENTVELHSVCPPCGSMKNTVKKPISKASPSLMPPPLLRRTSRKSSKTTCQIC